MARTRALLTGNERESLASEEKTPGSRRYQVISEVRNRINEELATDLEVLAKHHPELLSELQTVVCECDCEETGM